MTESEPNAWWNTLRHEGVLISPIVLDDWLPDGPSLVEDRAVDKLRQHYYRFTDDVTQLRPFLDAVLEDFLGHSKPNWRKEHEIPDRFKHQGKKPNRVLLNAGKEHQPRFMVLIDDERVADESGKPHRLGLHSGRRKHADLLRLMRATDVKLGVLTNGHHFRLVYAGMDHESWAEWSAEAWFQGGHGRIALHGLFTLLGVKTLSPDSDSDRNELLVKVQESRDRQADLSHVMGTQIREAVEMLMEELTDSLTPENRDSVLAPLHKLGRSKDEELQSIYQGAIRCIMRLIVQLYAESRALLPKQERLYYESYSVEGLYQMLKRAAADGREGELRSLRSAWPRLLASWRAIHDGSIHKDLQIQSYGGQLFRPYAANPQDTILAAIAVLEDPRVHVSDWAIHEVLEKLRIGKYKVGRGKWRKGPVDFSDLRTEYIGMMYEGLLDYDLREARQEDGGIVFLSIGDQPALPLNILAAQQPEDIKRLIKEQSKKNKAGAESPTEGEADEPADEDEAADELGEEADADAGTDDAEPEDTADEQFQKRVTAWAMKAVELGGLFGCTAAKLKKLDVPQREKLLLEAAHKMVLKAIPPGGMYLVRWSGTRKGSGTFYTKPGLAVPTTVRTLEPLVYDNHENREHRVVKRPEEILALKVCDPAMGSGSFLVAALRFLASALKDSFDKYVIPKVEAGEIKATETGETAIGLLTERILRTRHEDHSGERMESALKRAVVEHCIYGVDLNPLAVELGKLSLWIETMDPSLRFTFLDHKIRCGNALVGSWLHEVPFYPSEAWTAHPGSSENAKAALKRHAVQVRKDLKVKTSQLTNQTGWFTKSSADDWGVVARKALREMHDAPDDRTREELFAAYQMTAGLERLRQKMDLWCAMWFWPSNAEERPTVADFFSDKMPGWLHETSETISKDGRLRFFHWELEFPDVFAPGSWGFDAIIANPPWDSPRPQRDEYFLRYDPAFVLRGPRGKEEYIERLFSNSQSYKAAWEDYEGFFGSFKHYVFSAAAPFGSDDEYSSAVRRRAKPLAPAFRPRYSLQENTTNLYKMFLELAATITKSRAEIGMVVPWGLFSGRDTGPLRNLLWDKCATRFVYGFVNTKKIFPIESRQRFAVIVVDKGAPSAPIRIRFQVEDTRIWETLNPGPLAITVDQIRVLSPKAGNLSEFESQEVLEFTTRVYKSAVPVGDWVEGLEAGRDLWSTKDSKHFLRPEELPPFQRQRGVFWSDGTRVARQVYVGGNVHQLEWRYTEGQLGSQDHGSERPDLMEESVFQATNQYRDLQTRLVFRRISRSDDRRTIISAVIPNTPTIESLLFFKGKFPLEKQLVLAAVFNSYVFDFVARQRVEASVGWYIMDELPIPRMDAGAREKLAAMAGRLNLSTADYGFDCRPFGGDEGSLDMVQKAAMREKLDAVVAQAFALSDREMKWILRPDNPDRRSLWKDYRERLKILEAAGLKGKWYTLEEAREIRRKAGMEVDF